MAARIRVLVARGILIALCLGILALAPAVARPDLGAPAQRVVETAPAEPRSTQDTQPRLLIAIALALIGVWVRGRLRGRPTASRPDQAPRWVASLKGSATSTGALALFSTATS